MFQKGEPRPENAGRTKGTPNKRTTELLDILKELGCNPFEFQALVITEKLVDRDGELVAVTLDQRIICARDLAPYLLPKQKAIEVSGSLTVNVTPAEQAAEQSIEAVFQDLTKDAKHQLLSEQTS